MNLFAESATLFGAWRAIVCPTEKDPQHRDLVTCLGRRRFRPRRSSRTLTRRMHVVMGRLAGAAPEPTCQLATAENVRCSRSARRRVGGHVSRRTPLPRTGREQVEQFIAVPEVQRSALVRTNPDPATRFDWRRRGSVRPRDATCRTRRLCTYLLPPAGESVMEGGRQIGALRCWR